MRLRLGYFQQSKRAARSRHVAQTRTRSIQKHRMDCIRDRAQKIFEFGYATTVILRRRCNLLINQTL